MKLTISKIRGVTSYGMLCSESELNLSDESEGITELKKTKYSDKGSHSSSASTALQTKTGISWHLYTYSLV